MSDTDRQLLLELEKERDRYKAALEKILRLREASARGALDAVLIAKNALLGIENR